MIRSSKLHRCVDAGYTDLDVRVPGGFSHWHGIRICACLLGHFFAKFGIAIGGFSSETKEPKLHKLGVFGANYCKKHPIWSKLGAFLSKMVYWWVGNLAKNWYRDSQIFEVRQAHPRTILVKEPPRGQGALHQINKHSHRIVYKNMALKARYFPFPVRWIQ